MKRVQSEFHDETQCGIQTDVSEPSPSITGQINKNRLAAFLQKAPELRAELELLLKSRDLETQYYKTGCRR